MGDLATFRSLIFTDACGLPVMGLYKRAYFAGLLFADRHLTAKSVKIGPLEISRYVYSIDCFQHAQPNLSYSTITTDNPATTLHCPLSVIDSNPSLSSEPFFLLYTLRTP